MGLPHLRGLVVLNLAYQGEIVTVSLKGGVTECLCSEVTKETTVTQKAVGVRLGRGEVRCRSAGSDTRE